MKVKASIYWKLTSRIQTQDQTYDTPFTGARFINDCICCSP